MSNNNSLSVEEQLAQTKEKLARAYSNVIGVIDGACNASGVVLSFAEDIIAVRHGEALGTDETNKHPLVQLYLHQLAFLATGRELLTDAEFSNALAWCRAKKGEYNAA